MSMIPVGLPYRNKERLPELDRGDFLEIGDCQAPPRGVEPLFLD